MAAGVLMSCRCTYVPKYITSVILSYGSYNIFVLTSPTYNESNLDVYDFFYFPFTFYLFIVLKSVLCFATSEYTAGGGGFFKNILYQ